MVKGRQMSAQMSSNNAQFDLPVTGVLSPPICLRDLPTSPSRQANLALNRAFDIVGALLRILLLAPLFPFLALPARFGGGPARYGHRRIGCNGRPFKCVEFRCMALNAEEMLAHHLAANLPAAAAWAHPRKLTEHPHITRIWTVPDMLMRRSAV